MVSTMGQSLPIARRHEEEVEVEVRGVLVPGLCTIHVASLEPCWGVLSRADHMNTGQDLVDVDAV